MRTFGSVLAAAACLMGVFFWYAGHTPPKTGRATFGGASLTLDYATTEAARERGLGGKASVREDYGMLFVFPESGRYGFWMKGMLVPVDIFWLDTQGHVVSIQTNVATSTYPNVFYPTEPSRYVLETAAGFGRVHGIATGTPLFLQKFPEVSE